MDWIWKPSHSSASVAEIHLLVVTNWEKGKWEMDLIFPPPGRRFRSNHCRKRRPRCGRGRGCGWRWGGRGGGGRGGGGLGLGKRPDEEGVKSTEAAEGENYRSELLVAAAGVSPVSGADQLPKPLIFGGFMPLLAHTGRHSQSPSIHMFKNLKQQIIIQIHKSSLVGAVFSSTSAGKILGFRLRFLPHLPIPNPIWNNSLHLKNK